MFDYYIKDGQATTKNIYRLIHPTCLSIFDHPMQLSPKCQGWTNGHICQYSDLAS